MINQDKIFDIDHLVNRLKFAAQRQDARVQVKSILEASLSDPERVAATMPDYEENDITLFEDDTVSIWHCRFPVGKTVPAHDHQMVATIAVYQGTERNDMWVRSNGGGLKKRPKLLFMRARFYRLVLLPSIPFVVPAKSTPAPFTFMCCRVTAGKRFLLVMEDVQISGVCRLSYNAG